MPARVDYSLTRNTVSGKVHTGYPSVKDRDADLGGGDSRDGGDAPAFPIRNRHATNLAGSRGVVEGDLAADDGVDHVGGEDFVFGDGHDVAREDGDVGEFAGFQRAFELFFESRVGVVDGVRLQGLHAGHALVRVEDGAVLEFAADARIEAGKRADIFD